MPNEPHRPSTEVPGPREARRGTAGDTRSIGAERGRQEGLVGGLDGALRALLELVPLDDLPRTGWILRGVERPESIAGHVLGVAHVALALAPRVDPGLDLGRVLAMALVHDAPEALSGDVPQPASAELPEGAKRDMEARLAERVVAPLSAPAASAYAEYGRQETREARFVRACDRLQLGVRLLAYERAGREGLDEFWSSVESAASFGFEPCDQLLAALQAASARRDLHGGDAHAR